MKSFLFKLIPIVAFAALFFNFYKKDKKADFKPISNTFQGKSTSKAEKSFAVLELFTSEGCSSCPSADEILRGVADEDNVFALSFQVTYWNRLGWKDPFSQKIFDERQYSYATKFNKEGVYTPQLVVNGHEEFVGSNKNKVQKSIENALAEDVKTEISLTKTKENETLKINFQLTGDTKNTLLNFAIVERNLTSKVMRGENEGRILKHDNVVRHFETIKIGSNTEGVVSVKIDANWHLENCAIIAYLQDDSWRILGANKLKF